MSVPRSRSLLVAGFAAAILPILVLFAWQAIRTYWLCDDAYISFRYVRNLVEGHGLVFNPGERVEGYTNFLWVLELAAIWKVVGLRPEVASSLISLLYTAGAIALTAILALRTPFRERRFLVAAGALLCLAASHTFAIWSTSGLETRQFTFLLLAAAVCLQSKERPRLVLASLALAAAYERSRCPWSLRSRSSAPSPTRSCRSSFRRPPPSTARPTKCRSTKITRSAP